MSGADQSGPQDPRILPTMVDGRNIHASEVLHELRSTYKSSLV